MGEALYQKQPFIRRCARQLTSDLCGNNAASRALLADVVLIAKVYQYYDGFNDDLTICLDIACPSSALKRKPLIHLRTGQAKTQLAQKEMWILDGAKNIQLLMKMLLSNYNGEL
ncbi:Hypothetical predicted protein [Scomber scombrus]|uniref:Uncharacterized protein n=1 Tax=Scomber scombrus TaxID=13677 RepID=A0AAV1N716_SCOSC